MINYEKKMIKGKTFREWENKFISEQSNINSKNNTKMFFKKNHLNLPFENLDFDFQSLQKICKGNPFETPGIVADQSSIDSDKLNKLFASVNENFANYFMLNLALLFFFEKDSKIQLEFDF